MDFRARVYSCWLLLLLSASPSLWAEDQAAVSSKLATFAGGCFWCMEPPFDKLPGVLSTTSGYSGGHLLNPSYKQVTKGNSGHLEVLQVSYDPAVVSYAELLQTYWRNIDPFDSRGQFCDQGESYRAAIFYHDDEQKTHAQQSLAQLAGQQSQTVVTELRQFERFYPAETYHQDYYQKNPRRYQYYRWRCGRDQRLQELWGQKP